MPIYKASGAYSVSAEQERRYARFAMNQAIMAQSRMLRFDNVVAFRQHSFAGAGYNDSRLRLPGETIMGLPREKPGGGLSFKKLR